MMGADMKWNDLIESRRNPEKNTRFSGHIEACNYIDTLPGGKNGPYGVSMTHLPKLGVNPNLKGQDKETPTGIYYYPVDFYYNAVKYGGELPHGHNFAYINVFEMDNTDMVNLQNRGDGEVKIKAIKNALADGRVKKICGEKSERTLRKIIDLVNQVNSGEIELEDAVPPLMLSDIWENMVSSTGALFWGLTKTCGMTSSMIKWNKLLREIGVTAVEDNGGEIIHYNEPYQGVILDPSVIISNKLFSNRLKREGITAPWYSKLVQLYKTSGIDSVADITLSSMSRAFKGYSNFTPRQKRLPHELEKLVINYWAENGSFGRMERYAELVGGRIKQIEDIILDKGEALYAYSYALHILKGRWPEAEPMIASDEMPIIAIDYAQYILKDPDPKTWAERYLKKELLEARRNPEKNTRFSGHIEACNYIDTLPGGKNGPYGVSMTHLPKLGINPNLREQNKETPTGIYYYPVDFYYNTIKHHQQLPYGHSHEYINVFEMNKTDMANLGNQGECAYLIKAVKTALTDGRIMKICGEKSEEVVTELIRLVNQVNSGEIELEDFGPSILPDIIWENILSSNGAYFWGLVTVCGMTSSMIKWNKLLREIGVTGVEDHGDQLIHHNEPYQGVILDPSIIINNKMFNNNFKRENGSGAWYSELVNELTAGNIGVAEFCDMTLSLMGDNFESSSFTRLPMTIEHKIFEYLISSGQAYKMIDYAAYVKTRIPQIEELLLNNSADGSRVMAYYADVVIGGRWEQAEPFIAKSNAPFAAINYATLIKDPDPKTWAERYLKQHGISN